MCYMHTSSNGLLLSQLGLAEIVYTYTVYDRIFGEFPANYIVHTPHIYDIWF